VDAARTRSGGGGGTGIGLAIAKSVVEAHGGHIWANSEPGDGAEFHFDLPVVPAAEASPAKRERGAGRGKKQGPTRQPTERT
ncbi:MAG: ATP-binding protein, partial [Actinomycetota bacterium]